MNHKLLEEMKRHLPPLSHAIDNCVMDYMADHFDTAVHIDLVLNLFVSAFMTSLHGLMKYVSKDHPDVLNTVETMLEEMKKHFQFKTMLNPKAN